MIGSGLKQYDLSQLAFVLIDDKEFDRRLIANLLRAFKVSNLYSFTHETAVSGLKQHPPEILICDWGFPKDNGLELTSYIRHPDSPFNSAIAIIMTSAEATSDNIIKARGAGVDQFLIKPLSPLTLYKSIVRCIESSKPLVRIDDYLGPDRRHSRLVKDPPPCHQERRKLSA